MVERREVAANVQGEPVHRDPMPDADADRGDLSIFDPDAGQARPGRGGDPDFGQGFDQQLFQPAQITMEILAASAQVDDRIADQLARPVIGRLSAAIDRKERMRQMAAPRKLDWSGVRPIV